MAELAAAKRAFKNILVRSIVVPMVVMAILAAGLIWQVGQLNAANRWVEHTDYVIARLYETEKLLVDKQAGVRGYLLTGDEPYLEPYTNAQANTPRLIQELRTLVSDRPAAVQRIDEINALRIEWDGYASERIAAKRAGESALSVNYGQGNEVMKSIRAKFAVFIREEEALRAERNAATQSTAMLTMWSAGVATVLAGLGLAFVARTQLHQLADRYEKALAQARDLSEQLERRVEERTKELTSSNGLLGEANKELEAFAYSISHDLRAPMRHITGFADLVRKSPSAASIDKEDRENLDIIYDTAVLAGRMVDDLLAFSRVGRTQLRISDIDVNAIVKSCVHELTPDTKNRQIEWKVADLLPTRGDSALVKMVFQNLIANAVKYTQTREHAKIEVSSKQEKDGVTYTVRDNGVGFDMAYVHKLFGVFQRLHRAEEFEGTGIGLANVRRIIVRHGGQVWAEGIQNAGAAFYVHLPN